MSIVLFPAIILLHVYASDFLHLKCMVLTFILFLETALVSMCISPKSYSMEIHNLKKSAHITRSIGQYEHVV